MAKKIPLKILAISFLFLHLLLFSGCFLMESDEQKAEKFYQLGLRALKEKKTEAAILQLKNAVQKNPSHAQAHFQLGRLYIETEQASLAASELAAAIQKDPSLTEAKKMLAMLYFKSRSFPQAITLYKDLIASGEKDLDTFLFLADALTISGKKTEAKEILSETIVNYPQSAKPKMSMARVLMLDNDPEEARKMMEAAAAANPRDASVRILLSFFYEKMGLYDETERELTDIRRDFPGKSIAYLAAANFYQRRNRLDKSEASLKEAINKGLADHNIYQSLALNSHRQKNFTGALENFKKASDLAPDDQKSLILLADYYAFLKRFPESRVTYEKIAEKWPKLKPIKSKIAELLLSERRYDEATKHIEEIIQENPNEVAGYLLSGILKMQTGKKDQAGKEFLKASELDPKSAAGHFYYGLTLMDKQDYRLSIYELSKALEQQPDSIKIRTSLAYVYIKSDKPALALEELNFVLNAQPDNLQARMLRGIVYQASRNYKAALEDYNYLLTKHPDSPLAEHRIAEIYLLQQKPGEALKIFKKILDTHPDPSQPIGAMVNIYVAEKDFTSALELCDDYLKKHPEDIPVSLIKASVYLSQGKHGAAEGLLSALIAKHPESDAPLIFRGDLHVSNKNLVAALQTYQKAVKINPENILALLKIAIVYQRKGDFDQAINSLEKLLKINDAYAPAANDLAFIYAERKQNLDRALDLALKARDLMPRDPNVADTLGWVYIAKGATDRAKPYLAEAIEGNPNNPQYHYHLGVALYKENAFFEARKSLQTAMKLGLGNKELASAQKMIGEIAAPDARYEAIRKDLDQAVSGQNIDLALSLAMQAREIMPKDADVANILGWIHIKKNSLVMAKKYLHEASQVNSNDPVTHYYLATVFYQEKDFTEAANELRRAMKLGLDKEKSATARKMLKDIEDKGSR